MKRAGLIVLGIIVLLSPLISLGCAVDDTAAPAMNFTGEINNLKAWKDSIEAWKSGVANWVAATDVKIAALQQTQTTPATTGYTKAEVDTIKNDLQAQINVLKTTTPTTTTPTTPTTSESQLIDTNKDLKLYLTDVDPNTDVFLLGAGSTNLRFEFDVKNTHATNSRQFVATVTLYPSISQTGGASTISTIFSDASMPTPAAASSTGLNALTISCTNGWVGKGDVQSITLLVALTSTVAAEWDYNVDIRQTN